MKHLGFEQRKRSWIERNGWRVVTTSLESLSPYRSNWLGPPLHNQRRRREPTFIIHGRKRRRGAGPVLSPLEKFPSLSPPPRLPLCASRGNTMSTSALTLHRAPVSLSLSRTRVMIWSTSIEYLSWRSIEPFSEIVAGRTIAHFAERSVSFALFHRLVYGPFEADNQWILVPFRFVFFSPVRLCGHRSPHVFGGHF